MTRPVSAVIPSLDDVELLERCLAPLVADLVERGVEDEILVVDDTGRDVLRGPIEERFPVVRVVPRDENGGFAAAVTTGARAAHYRLLLVLNPDVVVRPGCVSPLVEALLDGEVAAATPRVLLNGDPERIESAGRVAVEDGRLVVREHAGPPPPGDGPRPVTFPIGGAMLVRRDEFLARGGFDPLLAPFYWEDVDLGIEAWRTGRRVVEVPASVVEHHHRGTIGASVPDEVVRAAVERNRLLVHWKHLSGRREAHDHVASLWRDALDAGLADRREELVWMALALDELRAVDAARERLGRTRYGVERALELGG